MRDHGKWVRWLLALSFAGAQSCASESRELDAGDAGSGGEAGTTNERGGTAGAGATGGTLAGTGSSGEAGGGGEPGTGGDSGVAGDSGGGAPPRGGTAGTGGSGPVVGWCPAGAPVGDVYLEQQSDVSALEGVECLDGSLYVRGSVTDLSALASLTLITGSLVIEGASRLPSLTGLEGLRTVSGSVIISSADCNGCEGNSALEDISALDGLGVIGRNLRYDDICGSDDDDGPCREPARLVAFEGFRNLGTIGGDLAISDTTALESIGGFDRLAAVDEIEIARNNLLARVAGFSELREVGSLILANDGPLSDISGFTALTRLRNTLYVGLDSLDNLDAFANITVAPTLLLGGTALADISALDGIEVTARLQVSRTALTRLDELHAVTSLSGELSIDQNEFLEDLHGLGNLSHVEYVVVIMSNPSLPTCEAQWLIDNIGPVQHYTQNEGNDDAGICL